MSESKKYIPREEACRLIKRTYLEYAFALRYLNVLSQGKDINEARKIRELYRNLCNFFGITVDRFSIIQIESKIHLNLNKELVEANNVKLNEMLRKCKELSRLYDLGSKDDFNDNPEVGCEENALEIPLFLSLSSNFLYNGNNIILTPFFEIGNTQEEVINFNYIEEWFKYMIGSGQMNEVRRPKINYFDLVSNEDFLIKIINNSIITGSYENLIGGFRLYFGDSSFFISGNKTNFEEELKNAGKEILQRFNNSRFIEWLDREVYCIGLNVYNFFKKSNKNVNNDLLLNNKESEDNNQDENRTGSSKIRFEFPLPVIKGIFEYRHPSVTNSAYLSINLNNFSFDFNDFKGFINNAWGVTNNLGFGLKTEISDPSGSTSLSFEGEGDRKSMVINDLSAKAYTERIITDDLLVGAGLNINNMHTTNPTLEVSANTRIDLNSFNMTFGGSYNFRIGTIKLDFKFSLGGN